MKKKIKIPIWNVSDSFRNVKKSEKYSILIQRNEKVYKFRNLKNAKKFVTSLENQITSDLIELNQYFSFCHKINIDLIRFCDSNKLRKLRNRLNGNIDNYSRLLSHPLAQSDILSVYVTNMLYDLEIIFQDYKNLIRANNRLNFIYADVICKEKAYKRLQSDVKRTLYEFEPIHADFELIQKPKYINLKIA